MSMGPNFAGVARRPHVLFLIILTAAVGGCGNAPVQTQPEAKAASAPRADGPDLLLAGALKAWAADQDPARALQLAAQATSDAPRRADAAWLHLRLCDEMAACDAAPLEARLKKLAAESGVVWLSVLKRAQAARDGRSEAQVLSAMSQAQHFNVYWNSLLHRVTTAAATPVSAQDTAPLTRSLSETSGWLSALTLPAFAPLASSCSTDRMRDPERRALCERIGRALERSDSYSAEGAGLGIAQRLAPPGSAAAVAVAQRIETAAYQSQAAAAVVAAQLEREKFSAEMIELMKQLPREQDVSLAILRWAGQPLTP
jgi:hypothetical protein